MQDFSFVAIDLETTGLDPKKDTIIEIACVRFSISLDDEGVFHATDTEERNMLVHPGCEISEEVSMITGITNEMLRGRVKWEEIRQKVRDFIGDAIIVGHNVLFDIGMLATHGVDLTGQKIIDTFELSELFSQKVESLNLGFLANTYHLIDPSEQEHRALTDTKISIRLFLYYLQHIRNLSDERLRLWHTLALRDGSLTLHTLSQIARQGESTNIESDFFDTFCSKTTRTDEPIVQDHIQREPTIIDTTGEREDELDILREALQANRHIELFTPGKKTAEWMATLLREDGISAAIRREPSRYLSVSYLAERVQSENIYERKEGILILKLVFWMLDTKTGLLDELKLYGDERTMIDIFRLSDDESNIWKDNYDETLADVACLITNLYDRPVSRTPGRKSVIKDLPLLEDIIRRKASREVSFGKLERHIETLRSITGDTEAIIHTTDMLSLIEGIYTSIPERPTGPNLSPPGDYGETYFVTQSMLWQRGFDWLIHTTNSLTESWKQWKDVLEENQTKEIQLALREVDDAITLLSKTHHQLDANTNIIINILEGETRLLFIPRSVSEDARRLLSDSIAYGVSLSTPRVRGFIERECGIQYKEVNHKTSASETIPRRLSYTPYHPDIIRGGTVILTTSQKHARDLGKTLRQTHPNMEVIIQGLSGGKGKMLANFLAKRDRSLLVGIIDTWRDEYRLWQGATMVIVAKMPFDAPTDSYFLARTVGMKNNFAEYSEPMVIIRVNTLIARILASGFDGQICTSDARLIETEWGKSISTELL